MNYRTSLQRRPKTRKALVISIHHQQTTSIGLHLGVTTFIYQAEDVNSIRFNNSFIEFPLGHALFSPYSHSGRVP